MLVSTRVIMDRENLECKKTQKSGQVDLSKYVLRWGPSAQCSNVKLGHDIFKVFKSMWDTTASGPPALLFAASLSPWAIPCNFLVESISLICVLSMVKRFFTVKTTKRVEDYS